MSLYTRQRQCLGQQRASMLGQRGLDSIQESNPLSSFYKAPVRVPDTKLIYQYFVVIQTRRYGEVLDLEPAIVRRHIKLVLKEHSPEWICRAIKYASWISEYTFSVHFAMRALNDYQASNGTVEYRGNKEESQPSQTVDSLWIKSTDKYQLPLAFG